MIHFANEIIAFFGQTLNMVKEMDLLRLRARDQNLCYPSSPIDWCFFIGLIRKAFKD